METALRLRLLDLVGLENRVWSMYPTIVLHRRRVPDGNMTGGDCAENAR
jgi:hypothetical protein